MVRLPRSSPHRISHPTTQATPHTAGVIAYYLSQQNISTSAMAAKLVSEAHQGQINMVVSAFLSI